ncbi:hypothetical protein [Streptomyces sp. NPDC007991]|uniref:hypothetical protein n=1 Tax=Streptomyces sp. NPDC007991 TaxID=3364803 RepID=UPI0036F18AB6
MGVPLRVVQFRAVLHAPAHGVLLDVLPGSDRKPVHDRVEVLGEQGPVQGVPVRPGLHPHQGGGSRCRVGPGAVVARAERITDAGVARAT